MGNQGAEGDSINWPIKKPNYQNRIQTHLRGTTQFGQIELPMCERGRFQGNAALLAIQDACRSIAIASAGVILQASASRRMQNTASSS